MTEIRLDAPSSFRVIRTDDGRLHCEGSFCRDGILEYRQPNGSIVRELRRSEANADKQAIDSFKFLPLVVEHPPIGLLTSKNYKEFAVGMTDSSAHYDSSQGVIRGLVSFFDSEAIAKIESKEKEQLSAGYTCDVIPGKGIWNGQEYDQEQINIRANHLALTSKGRAGGDVRLRLDSESGIGTAMNLTTIDKEEDAKRMATIRCDNVEYSNIPEGFASVVGSKFEELKDIKNRFDSFQEKLDKLNSDFKLVEQEKSDSIVKIQNLEKIINNADSTLKKLGFERNDSGDYIRLDKKKPEILEEETEEESELDEEGFPKKYKKKHKKMMTKTDSETEAESENETKPGVTPTPEPEPVLVPEKEPEPEVKTDSLSDLLVAWKEADELISDFSKNRFDSAFTVADIKRTVLSEIEPELDLTDKSDAYVDGVYSRIKTTRKDSKSTDYTKQLETALKSGGKAKFGDGGNLTDWEKQRCEAYKKPLTMSKSKLGAK